MLAFLPLLQQEAQAQSAASAEMFAHNVYKRYEANPEFSPLAPKAAPMLFSPGLLQLIRKDQRSTPRGYEGKLDFDPLCACQDADGLHVAQVQASLASAAKATIRLTLRFGQTSEARQIRLHLIWVSQGWRIDDVETNDMPSLQRFLR